ncbi:MAG: hypothetical protein ACM3X0_00360 [Bacteroidota bacterium]
MIGHSLLRTLVTLLLGSAATVALAQAADCANLPRSSVTIKRLEGPVAINRQYSYKALKGMSADYARHDMQILGLTRGQAVARLSSRSMLRINPQAHWECASHQVTVEYGFMPMTVYVGSEFPEGTCAYNEIYQHELRHVHVYQTHARKIEQELSETLKERFEDAPPSRGAAGETGPRLQQEINERWIPYIKRMLDKVNAEQREVDSPEEYERVAASCNGAIKKQLAVRR